MQGQLSTSSTYLEGGDSAQVTIDNLVVPAYKKSGDTARFSIFVNKDDENQGTIEAKRTIEFQVKDNQKVTEPQISDLTYEAKSKSDICVNGPGKPECEKEWWWVTFQVQDEESGLMSIDVSPEGKETYETQVYYR